MRANEDSVSSAVSPPDSETVYHLNMLIATQAKPCFRLYSYLGSFVHGA
jgi:hypothetical protein